MITHHLILLFPSPPTSSTGLIRNEKLTLFYMAALAAKPGPLCQSSSTRMWRLADSSSWPVLEREVMVERDFYQRFFKEEEWLGKFSVGKRRKVAVLGQPGIGKSSFGIWLLTHLLREKRTVVYSIDASKHGGPLNLTQYVFHRGVAFIPLHKAYLDLLLGNPAVVHIYDSITPNLGEECHQVLITSPDPTVWNPFVKAGAKTVFFPLFNYREMEALWDAEFGTRKSRDIMALRIRAWGLSTRAVFSPFQLGVKVQIDGAITSKTLEEMQISMREVNAISATASDKIAHSLFMQHADRETLLFDKVTLRSEAVARRVLREVSLREGDNVIRAVQQLFASPKTNSLAGTLYEKAVIDVFGRGGGEKYLVRRLYNGAASLLGKKKKETQPCTVPETLVTPRMPPTFVAPAMMQRFDTLKELVGKCGSGEWDLRSQYFQPKSPNFASIDFIGPGLRIYQVTVSPRHSLLVTSGRSDKEGLLPLALKLLPLLIARWDTPAPYLEVYFLVLEGTAKKWTVAQQLELSKEPKMKKTDAHEPVVQLVETAVERKEGNTSGFSIDGKVVEVRQYVMEVPLSVIEDWRQGEGDEQRRLDDVDEASKS